MDLFIVLIFSFFTAFLFDFLSIFKASKYLFTIQKESFKVISDKQLTDDQKQKALLSYTSKIFLTSLKLLFFFLLVLSPFTFLVLYGHKYTTTDFYGVLMSLYGMLITAVSFLIYFSIKKKYGRKQL